MTSISIGSIVALTSHPYHKPTDCDRILLCGEPSHVSPLMVVSEIMIEKRSSWDPNSGMELSKSGHFQCKCLWYSTTSGQFEEAWLASRLLKLIQAPVETPFNPSFGDLVTLKTASLEIGKKKSSLKQNGTNSIEAFKSINPLLSFVSPVMQVVGTSAPELKEPLFDTKTGETRRQISRLLIKCKFHNSKTDKLSEFLIPVESLEVKSKLSEGWLEKIDNYISDGIYLKVGSQNPMFQKSIIKPLRINSKLGTYYLEGEDLLDQKTVEYPIIQNEDDEQFEPIAEAFVKLPEFKTRGQVLTIESINKKSIKALDKDAYWKIIYLNRNGILSTRTIYSPEISYTLKPQDFSNATAKRTAQDYYLKAICIRKNHSERHFLIDKIQSIEVLPLSAQSNFAKLKTPITTGRAKLPSGPKKSRTKTH